MSDELRERVARAIGEAYCRDATHGEFGLADIGEAKEWLPEADAAIALVRDATLEEAATALQNLWRIEDCYGAAAAIRALKTQTTT